MDLRERIGRPYRRPLGGDAYTQEKEANGRAREQDCRQYFSQFGQFAHQEVLNVGGFGVVVKYAQADAQGRFLRHFIVKAPRYTEGDQGIRNIQMFQAEYLWNLRFMGCKHIPQLAWFNQYPVGVSTGPGPFPPGNEAFWAMHSKWYLFLQYLPYGDMKELLCKMNQRESAWPFQYVGIPARLMWRIFLCLTRACIGLAWPRLTLDESAVMAFEPGNVVTVPETLETIGPAAPVNIVHFDIDPSNIMIGDFQDEAPEHALQPVFKLGDFGLTQEITDQFDRAALIRLQYGGKHGYRAPEQERGKELVRLGLFQPDINTYGIHTNVWGIGVTMFSLITKTRTPSIPPFSSFNCTLQGQVADSYGWFLAEDANNVPRGMETLYQRFPAELRELVARCMCSDTQQRPTLGYLLPAIQHYIEQGDALEAQGQSPPGESNADLEQFCREFILGNQSEASTISQDDEEDEARDGLGPLPGAAVQAAAGAFRRLSRTGSLSTTNGASPPSVYGGNQPAAETWENREIVVGDANANAASPTSVYGGSQRPVESWENREIVVGDPDANDTRQSRFWGANGGSRAASIAHAQAEAQHLRRQSNFGEDDEVEMEMDYWN